MQDATDLCGASAPKRDLSNGGSRPRRLPPILSARDPVREGGRKRRVALLCAIASGPAALLGLPGGAAAATFSARDGATLQAAVASAEASGGSSTIELRAGTFLPASTLTISGDISIVGPSSGPGAKLDGGAVEPFPSNLVKVEAHAKLTLVNVELTHAGGAGSAGIGDSGALDLESSAVVGNRGIGVVVGPQASATVRNSTVSAGADFGLVDDGSASLFNATVASNRGGGIENRGRLRLTNTIVAGNGHRDCAGPASASDHSLD